jgi:hypothetical protein
MTRPATLAALVIAAAIALSPPVSADPAGDPGDVQQLRPPRPSQAALDRTFTALVGQIPGMHIIDATITDNGGRMVCKYLNEHTIADTTADLRHDNPTFTGAEAHAFVSDAMAVYCPAHIPQTIG